MALFFNGKTERSNDAAFRGEYSVKMTGRSLPWHSPGINIYPYIKDNGPGTYSVHMQVMATAVDEETPLIGMLIRTDEENSFSKSDAVGNYFCRLKRITDFTANKWYSMSGKFNVTDEDIAGETGNFNLMLDLLEAVDGQALYIDNVVIMEEFTTDPVSIDKASAYMYIGEKLQLNANKAGVVFSSDNRKVAKVTSHGEVTALSAGTAKITASYGAETAYCYITVDEKYHNVDDGEYFIRNMQYCTYLQLADFDSADTYVTGYLPVEAQSFSGRNNQRWRIQYIGDGYYTIKNTNSGLALSLQNGAENDERQLIQEIYGGTDRQKWQIITLDNGDIKFKPKSSEKYTTDWCLGVATNLGSSGERKVMQREYSGDGIYDDEWVLQTIGNNGFYSVSIEDDGKNRSFVFGDVYEYVKALGINECNALTSEGIEREEFFSAIDSARIFVSRSHGGSNEESTSIRINGNPATRIYSYDLKSMDLSNIEIAVFAACHSAENRDTGNNLIDASVAAGAQCAIGFRETVNTYEANYWVQNFFYYYAQGYKIDAAAKMATEKAGESTKFYEIAGELT